MEYIQREPSPLTELYQKRDFVNEQLDYLSQFMDMHEEFEIIFRPNVEPEKVIKTVMNPGMFGPVYRTVEEELPTYALRTSIDHNQSLRFAALIRDVWVLRLVEIEASIEEFVNSGNIYGE